MLKTFAKVAYGLGGYLVGVAFSVAGISMTFDAIRDYIEDSK